MRVDSSRLCLVGLTSRGHADRGRWLFRGYSVAPGSNKPKLVPPYGVVLSGDVGKLMWAMVQHVDWNGLKWEVLVWWVSWEFFGPPGLKGWLGCSFRWVGSERGNSFHPLPPLHLQTPTYSPYTQDPGVMSVNYIQPFEILSLNIGNCLSYLSSTHFGPIHH